MIRTSKIKLIILLSIIVSQSCNLKQGGKGLSEGILKYNITYLEDENENPIISLMPSQLDMSFKSNSVKMDVVGWMGVFKSSFIKNGSKNEAITLLKMMNKKYCYRSNNENGFLGFSAYSGAIVKFDDEVKTIIDFECKHAKVEIKDKDISFDIYYTDKIKIDNPNRFTPFSEVPGVLMEFQIEINGIPMYLIASEVIECQIINKEFEVPKDYEDVPREELEKIFSSLI